MSLVTSLAAVIGNSFYPLLAVATIWEWDNFTVCFRMCSYVATLKGQRLFKNWHMIKEMLILQYINGNELPTLPYRLFQKHTFYWKYYTFPGLPFCPRHTASILLYYLCWKNWRWERLGNENLGYALRWSGNKTCWNVLHMRTTAVWA